MAAVYTLDGGELCTGLQGCDTCDEAIQAAWQHADQLAADVHLQDDDGDWLVHPKGGGRREPADRLSLVGDDLVVCRDYHADHPRAK